MCQGEEPMLELHNGHVALPKIQELILNLNAMRRAEISLIEPCLKLGPRAVVRVAGADLNPPVKWLVLQEFSS